MRIVVDVGHPAHVHLFKNFIWEMKQRGHKILITATKKDVSLKLLDNHGFDYIAMGSYGDSLVSKVANIPIMDFKMLRAVVGFKPDIFVGVAPIRSSHVSKLIRKPCVAFDDTEHSRYEIFLYKPFVDAILTPSCFQKDLGKKQVRYNGYHELAYLHPNYFTPDPSVLTELGLSENDRFIILRFVSWEASHDVRQHGFTNPKEIISRLEPYGRVLITSEAKLDADLEKYRIALPPEKLHDLLYYATLYIGEGATIASECAVLGTPAIYVNTLRLGYLDEEEEKYGLVYNFSNPEVAQKQAVEKALELLQRNDLKEEWQFKRERLLQEKIDVTKFMVEFVENYS